MATAKTRHVGSQYGRNRKDPFLELSDDTQLREQPTSSNTKNHENHDASSVSPFLDFLLTPIYVVSFIFSLTVVERQQRQWRLSQHARQPQTVWERWFSSSEPYQQAPGTTWAPHYSWRRRGVAKLQINDVFEIRDRVAICTAIWTILALIGSAYATRWVYFWLFK
ncbi:uncharacterized protein RCC_04019 [Ramularia collo-cygni]|uniref:Uncharacterized protein n=1 Tax=Ramularia collo-cygni TaxID=112498 RepID=A0A2D3V9I1_9PEZI|nr:uncharacterized protein RCC_04019 [Ramularia collo-cygni]CZT18179.1 uncharacterized protein RCC_04019 [Ramularia collo-cygni]